MSGWWLVLALAWAQEEPAAVPSDEASVEEAADTDTDTEPPAEEATPEGGFEDVREEFEEVVVYSERMVEAAREEVMDRAKAEGYRREVRKDDRTILRHDAPYKGELVLWDDGRVELKRQPVRWEPPGGTSNKANWAWCIFFPACIRTGGQTVSKRRFRAYERSALAAVQPEVVDWNARISDYAIDRKVGDLPDRLMALWEQGRPIDSADEPLPTVEGRKAAILAYWDSRTDTEWGQVVQDAVATFIRAVVQRSEHPYTDEELEAFNAQRTSRRALVLEKETPDWME